MNKAYSDTIPMGGPQTAYNMVDDEDTLRPRWYDVKRWGWKQWGLVALIITVIIVVIAVAVVEEKKNNAYPDYSQLTYSLVDTYNGTNFFDNFDYFTGYDPASGFVHYLTAEQSAQYNLTYATDTSAILKVESEMDNQSTGRYSVRVTSKNTYNNGLFIFDVLHTPYGCGTWPALWLTDPANWPAHGEIDVMEAVNNASTGNQMTLHTSDGCSMDVKRKETAAVLTNNCYNGTDDNAGCGVQGDPITFGQQYNANGGGVVAMELRDAGIRMWMFNRSTTPSDIAAHTPDPSTWGTALADFPSTDCDIAAHFKNQSIIANIDLCGTWAGDATIYAGDNCPSNCTDYVANNPSAFETAYWEFGGFLVYQAASSSQRRARRWW